MVRRCRRFHTTSRKGGKVLFSPHLPCLQPGRKTGKTSSPSSSRCGDHTQHLGFRQNPGHVQKARQPPAARLGLPRERSWRSGCRAALWGMSCGPGFSCWFPRPHRPWARLAVSLRPLHSGSSSASPHHHWSASSPTGLRAGKPVHSHRLQ